MTNRNDRDRGAWSIVLAAGDGNRLKELTKTQAGDTVPKQFCSLNRRECLLQLALQRAESISTAERVGTVVAAQHRRWWRRPLQELPAGNVIVQPSNRGTAIGTALALLEIERQDPEAVVVLLPADHYVEQESVLAESLIELADRVSEQDDGTVFLLGAKPDFVDTELGYIVPGEPAGAANGVSHVREFVEKPSAAHARELLAAGALWNMFIVAGALPVLLGLFEKSYNFLKPMRAALRKPVGSLARLYGELPVVDFSRDVLAHYPQQLKVMAVPACGWTDLGTPERVAAIVAQRSRPGSVVRKAKEAMYLDLAEAVGSQ